MSQIEKDILDDELEGEAERLEEGKVKKAEKESDDSEEDEDEEEVEEASAVSEDDEEDEDEDDEVEEAVAVPKTKAAILASVHDMFKKAKKEEAVAMYTRMTRVTEEDEDDEDDEEVKESADVSHIDYAEDLDVLVDDEATLSEGFRDKAGVIFEAALKSKISTEVNRLESQYAESLEEEVQTFQSELIEKVDSYLGYVVDGWMKENEIQVVGGLRTEIAEEFMSSLQSVFTEHYIEVPEGKVDLVDELSDQVTELEEKLNRSVEDNMELHENVNAFQRAEVVAKYSTGLATTEAEKFASLVEDIDFEDTESFDAKVKTIKESFFKSDTVDQVDEADQLLGESTSTEDLTDQMSRYSRILTKFNN